MKKRRGMRRVYIKVAKRGNGLGFFLHGREKQGRKNKI